MPPTTAVLDATSVRRTRLSNGLEVLVMPVHTAPLVSVWSWYRVGSRDERPGRTGVSHWVEHMNFKGTTNIPRDQMKSLVERLGGAWNGYTWIDQTAYVETAASHAFDQLLYLEAERMTSALYEPHEVEAERSVIISELQGGDNDPEQLLETEVTASAFRAHPYRHPTIGWLEDLQAIRRDDLYEHYREYYVPNNATLVVVGDVDADEVFRAAERRFGHIAPGPEPRRVAAIEPPQIGERRVRVERSGTTGYLKFAWRAPAAADPDFFPMLVLDAVLTGAKGLNLWASYPGSPPQRKARLYTSLVERGLASAVSGALLPTAEPFLYLVSFTAMEGVDLDSLEVAASDAIDEIRRKGPGLREVSRARRQLRARLVLENDSVTNLAHQLGYCATVAGPDFFAGLQAGIDAVTPEQVADVAVRRLSPKGRTVGRFEPQDGRP